MNENGKCIQGGGSEALVFEDRNRKSSCMKRVLKKAMASLEAKRREEDYGRSLTSEQKGEQEI